MYMYTNMTYILGSFCSSKFQYDFFKCHQNQSSLSKLTSFTCLPCSARSTHSLLVCYSLSIRYLKVQCGHSSSNWLLDLWMSWKLPEVDPNWRTGSLEASLRKLYLIIFSDRVFSLLRILSGLAIQSHFSYDDRLNSL